MPDSINNICLYQRNESISVEKSGDNSSPYHCHNFLEIAYVDKGSAVHYFNDQSVIVHEGDYFAVDYNEVHGYSPNGNDDFSVINIIFKPEFIDASLKDCRGFSDLVSSYSINYHYFSLVSIPTKIIYRDDNFEVHSIFSKMLNEYTNRNPKYKELLRCYLTELIIITLRKIHDNSDINYTNDTINKILDYANQNYMNDIKLSDISAELGYSLPYISALFTKLVSISFSKYIQNIRIENACHLLINTDKKIEEISGMVGYKDIKFFRKIFKDKLKMSPKNFRDMSRRKAML